MRYTGCSVAFHVSAIRRQFPILHQQVGGNLLVYLDNAATTQKPRAVLDAMQKFYEKDNANVHRGMHGLAERATLAYEGARSAVQKFVHAAFPEEIIFTKSCTEALNIVARCWARAHMKEGDAIVLTILEHHSNIVPWLQLKDEIGIELRWIDIDDAGNLRLDQIDAALKDGKVKMIAITGQSNVLGVRPDIPSIVRMAHASGALVCVDAAQLVGHGQIDVQNLDCDFLAFSGHKLYGSTGIGVLYGKSKHLNEMDAWLGGGMMIREVHQDRFVPADVPARFEGGTPPVAEAVGLRAAIDWLQQYAWDDIAAHEQSLIARAIESLSALPGIHLLGSWNGDAGSSASGCLSFTLDNIHPHDLTQVLGDMGICLRAGHHCAQPLHRRFGIPASTRLSVAAYNTLEEIDAVAPAIRSIQKKFRPAS